MLGLGYRRFAGEYGDGRKDALRDNSRSGSRDIAETELARRKEKAPRSAQKSCKTAYWIGL